MSPESQREGRREGEKEERKGVEWVRSKRGEMGYWREERRGRKRQRVGRKRGKR